MSQLFVDITPGGSYAPTMYYYRIRRDDEHERAMRHIAKHGGHEPNDIYGRDNNILISYDDAVEIVSRTNKRKVKDLRDGWDVTVKLDRWEAFAYYGYDAGDALA